MPQGTLQSQGCKTGRPSKKKRCFVCQGPARMGATDDSRLPSSMEIAFAKAIEAKITESGYTWTLDAVRLLPICSYECRICALYMKHVRRSAVTCDAQTNAAGQEAQQNTPEEEENGEEGEENGEEGEEGEWSSEEGEGSDSGWRPPTRGDFGLKHSSSGGLADDEGRKFEENVAEGMWILFILQCAKGRVATNEFFQTDPHALGRMQGEIADLLEKISDVEREQKELSIQTFVITQEVTRLRALCEENEARLRNLDPNCQRKRRGVDLDLALPPQPPAIYIELAPDSSSHPPIELADGIVELVRRTANTSMQEDISQPENSIKIPPTTSQVVLQRWIREHPSSCEASGHQAMMILLPPRPPHSRSKRLRTQRDKHFFAILQVLIIPGQYAAIIQQNSFQVTSVALSALDDVDDVDRLPITELARHLARKGLTAPVADDCGQYCRKFAEVLITSNDTRYDQETLKQLLVRARNIDAEVHKVHMGRT
ncbi:hypothetical protein C8F04DRAFT_1197060 [Mycena alexandri]|uniref:Uncharacterized protein n=1 Tax=Mycena alexandri TaxID=1745969 RepID=A0AAD6S3B7_9AGAR|nr:hypothetical protein C8F04DRAFT_1197060 [Mycena alexandri]